MKLLWLVILGLVVLPACIFGGDDGFDARGARSFSNFPTGADGWRIVGDAQAQSSEPDYNGMGGNPDGLISAKDDAVGGVWYFEAPAKYLGNAALTYGKKLEFDLKTSNVENPFDDYDVILQGGGLTIVADNDLNPSTTDWTSYSIKLDETGGWKKIDGLSVEYSSKMRFMGFPAPTKDEVRAVLAAITLLRIRGEYNTGEDTGSLDNVRFGSN